MNAQLLSNMPPTDHPTAQPHLPVRAGGLRGPQACKARFQPPSFSTPHPAPGEGEGEVKIWKNEPTFLTDTLPHQESQNLHLTPAVAAAAVASAPPPHP